MRVLWFSLSHSLYKNNSSYNGVGWVASLQKLVMKSDDIESGVAFIANEKSDKIVQNGVTYYPMNIYNNFFKKLDHFIFFEKYFQKELQYFLKVVEDFKPDVIHVCGSEGGFGLLSSKVNVPVVLHIQGIINPYVNAWFPAGMNKYSYIWGQKTKLRKLIIDYRIYQLNKLLGKRESVILAGCKNYLGRTEWDRRVSQLYSPDSTYYHVEEVLRDSFYNSEKWRVQSRKKKIIISTISTPLYKGADFILKTAALLKQFGEEEFEWRVFGVHDIRLAEKITGIKASDVSVIPYGVASEEQLVTELLNADLYFHSSYIDNSPNSVCEAQLLGLPVIAANVGGVSSLITDRETGFLIPSNDPYTGVSKILELLKSPELCAYISSNAIRQSETRHDRDAVAKTLCDVYSSLISD